MNYEPSIDGSEGLMPPHGDASTPQWQVLARLPYVGDATEHEELTREWDRTERCHTADGPISGRTAQPLRIADEIGDFRSRFPERVDYAQTPPKQQAETRGIAAADAPQTESRSPARQPRYRFDAGDPRRCSPAAPMRMASPQDEPQTLAARVFQWHAALAPYAGLAMTFVLAMFAGLLYWSTFGRPAALPNGPTAAPVWTADVDSAAQNPVRLASPVYDSPESPLSYTPLIRLEIPPLGELAAEPKDVAAATPDESEPATSAANDEAKPIEGISGPGNDAAAAEPQLSANGQAPASDAPQQEPAMSAPLTTSYPTTPFATFEFGPTAHQAAAPAETPAAMTPR